MPEQLVRPCWQESEHLPAVQTSPERQAVAQVPQFCVSLCRLVQKGAPASPPPHLLSPLPHDSAQAPAVQTSPTLQPLPQAPQFFRSVCRLAQ